MERLVNRGGVVAGPHTAGARVRYWASLYGTCGGKSGTRADFLRVLRLSAVIVIPPMVLIVSCIRHSGA